MLAAVEEERISCISPPAIKSVEAESFSRKHRDTSHIHTNPSAVKLNRNSSCDSSSAHSSPIMTGSSGWNPLEGAIRYRWKFVCEVGKVRRQRQLNGNPLTFVHFTLWKKFIHLNVLSGYSRSLRLPKAVQPRPPLFCIMLNHHLPSSSLLDLKCSQQVLNSIVLT